MTLAHDLTIESTFSPASGAEATFACEKAMARGMANHWPPEQRLPRAHAFCAELVAKYWEQRWVAANRQGFELTPPPSLLIGLNQGERVLCEEMAKQLSRFTNAEAGYLIGTIYTVLLPTKVRTDLGAFYTPPCLVDRLLDKIGTAGFDWVHGTALDPACGGGAFLAPLALRMVGAMSPAEPAFILASLARRLAGFEIDPFAAWISQALLEIELMQLSWQARRRVPLLVSEVDSLRHDPERQFDLIVGNPPYGRTSLDINQRLRFAQSLYGHANLYGVFTHVAMSWLSDRGILAYITPTSFLGGQYFKSLRSALVAEVEPRFFEFVSARDGVFDGVLQETMLAVYKKERENKRGQVSLLAATGLSSLTALDLGPVTLPERGEQVWLMPRSAGERGLVARLQRMTTRFGRIGYKICTGPLVWNRHKRQLRADESGERYFPLIWAEGVRDGAFNFKYAREHHAPFLEVEQLQPWLVTRQSCVLCQRTTSKEQGRRLVAAVLPQDLVDKYGGVVVENHLNMFIQLKSSRISPATISVLLNSEAVDRAFRCISGSVAVSAFELNSLPIPSVEELLDLEALVRGRASERTIEEAINDFYGL